MISGIITGLLLAAFLAITYWAYSSRNRARWEQVAQLPLQEDRAVARCCCGGESRCGTGERS